MDSPARVIGIYGYPVDVNDQRVVEGLLQFMDERGGYRLRDFRKSDAIQKRQTNPPPWRSRCDGVVVNFAQPEGMNDAETAIWVLSGGVPAVSLSGIWMDPRIVLVASSYQLICPIAAEHLVACDCQSFLYLGLTASTGSAAQAESFAAALAKLGHSTELHFLQEPMFGSFADAATVKRDKALVQKLRRLPKPLGVWVLADEYAAAVYLLCEQLGLRIPDDVRVLGLGDNAVARLLRPMLSSVHLADEKIGYRAMETLHAILLGKRVPRTVRVEGGGVAVRGSTMANNTGPSPVSESLSYIARHACSGMSVDELAHAMNFPRRSFERSFRQLVGCSVGEEIQRVRLTRAKELLRQPELSVGRIATMVGFEEVAAFSKFFQKHTGQSPSEYRVGL